MHRERTTVTRSDRSEKKRGLSGPENETNLRAPERTAERKIGGKKGMRGADDTGPGEIYLIYIYI